MRGFFLAVLFSFTLRINEISRSIEWLFCSARSIEIETKQEHWPNADVYHYIGCIKYVVPERYVLDVNEVDNAAIYQAIYNIAGPATDDKPKADIFVALNRFAECEIEADNTEQRHTQKTEEHTHTLEHTEDAAVISHVCEMDEAQPFDGFTLRQIIVYPGTYVLGGGYHRYGDSCEQQHVYSLGSHGLDAYSAPPTG